MVYCIIAVLTRDEFMVYILLVWFDYKPNLQVLVGLGWVKVIKAGTETENTFPKFHDINTLNGIQILGCETLPDLMFFRFTSHICQYFIGLLVTKLTKGAYTPINTVWEYKVIVHEIVNVGVCVKLTFLPEIIYSYIYIALANFEFYTYVGITCMFYCYIMRIIYFWTLKWRSDISTYDIHLIRWSILFQIGDILSIVQNLLHNVGKLMIRIFKI